MNRSLRIFCLCLLQAMFLAECSTSTPVSADELPPSVPFEVDFERHVRPILQTHCVACHGSEKQESGLRLDRRAALLTGGDQGLAVVSGDSSKSRLIHYVAGLDPEKIMPPDGERLSNEEIGILRSWIDQGISWPQSSETQNARSTHWAYQPLKVVIPPDVRDKANVRNEIDRFIQAELDRRGYTASSEASRTTLIRRLSLDLTGLLPSIAEVEAFEASGELDAYEQLVDRLLASPHFGERWGRHWLDMARYADSDGYEKDNPRPDAWRWRDWVIDAFNSDMPFDQFTVEQLAGDLIPEATPMQRLATAFHRQTLTNTEGGADQEQFRVEACFDRTETTGTVWLGLTVGCARCHTHKYDAITQREYYQLFSIFNNGDETNAVVPKSETEIQAYGKAKSAFDAELDRLTQKIAVQEQQNEAAFSEWQTEARSMLAKAAVDPVKHHPLKNLMVTGDDGIVFDVQKGGVVHVSGANPERAVYTITGETDLSEITGLRLEVLPDKSLPSMGPGRVSHGNFVLSELTAEIASRADFSDAEPLPFSSAKADFEQSDKSWPARNVIDGKPDTGWAIAPQFGRKHWLNLGLGKPLDVSARKYIRVRLSQQYGLQHTIGRFQVKLQSGADPETALPGKIAELLHMAPDRRTAEQLRELREYYGRQESSTRELYEELDAVRKKEPPAPELSVRVIAQRVRDPRRTFVLRRGEFLDPIADLEVKPAMFSTLPPLTSRTENSDADRLDLARWLVSRNNPLTPRVTVNHVWRHLFGHGLVRTPNDFGVRGDAPVYPELLDWLAAEFQAGCGTNRPWSRKALIRKIVMSATYRQASARRMDLEEIDPQNVLFARQNRLRVEGEIVRDISLDAAGLLSRKIGGPSVYPPLPPGIAELSYAGNFKWTESQGEDRFRRGMYTFFKRTSPHPNLIMFDCPDANLTCVERQMSNTPLQALTSLNNETFAEAARGFARRILKVANQDTDVRLQTAMRICLSRHGSASELLELHALLNDATEWYESHAEQAALLIGADRAEGVSEPVNAAWISVARVLLNLDEFITRE